MDKEQYIKTTQYGTEYYSDKAMTVRHREDGPASVYSDGDKYWYINGKLHREDGPAVLIDTDGVGEVDKYWYINGKRHREGAPAVEWAGGGKDWFINGKHMNEDGTPHSA
jgi:hypothetical protein|tara:strand:- start:577 stop:906 length:330 start_codon:yes stop_codon:yes gene_type:complete